MHFPAISRQISSSQRISGSFALGVALSVFALLLFPSSGSAQEKAAEKATIPGAPRLLPEDTFLYARLDNAEDLRVDMKNSSIGQMLNDPKMRPLATDIYGTFRELFDQVSEAVGVTLDELLAIPDGQVAAALIPGQIPEPHDNLQQDEDDESDEAIQRRLRQKRRSQNSFAGVFMVDAGDNVESLRTIIERLETRITNEDSYVRRVKEVRKTEIVRLLPPRTGRPEIEYFERDGTIVFGIGHKTAQDVLDHWDGEGELNTLADSSNFASVMSRCVGAEETRPQITFYADPYHIAERIVRRSGSFSIGMIWPVVQELGLERLRGIGASSFRGGETFESISHLHILLDPPRDGLLGVLRPSTGDSTPPKWVPKDVTTYSSIHWDFEQTYENVGKIMEKFQGEDALKRLAEEPVKKMAGVDIQKDIIENLSGRFVRVSWIEPPARLNSQVGVQAFELNDTMAAKSLIADLRQKFPNLMTAETVGGKVVYFFRSPGRVPETFRKPEPCFFIMGKWIIQTDSRKMVERITRANAGVIGGLVDVPEYELISAELGGKLDGQKPFLVSFMRGADLLRQFYQIAASDGTKQFIRQRAEDDPNAGRFAEVLERNDFPAFEEFEQYFAPSGTFAYDQPDGIHFGTFTLRADSFDDK